MAGPLVVNMSLRILFLILRVCKTTEKKSNIGHSQLTTWCISTHEADEQTSRPSHPVWCHLSDLCSDWFQTVLITIFALIFLPLPLFFPAGWVLSTMISKASSSSWRGASTPTGKPTAALCPTTPNASCHSAPSTVLWVAAEGGKGWGIQKWKGTR